MNISSIKIAFMTLLKVWIFFCLLSCRSTNDRYLDYGFVSGKVVADIQYLDDGCFGSQLSKIVVVDSASFRRAVYVSGRDYTEIAMDAPKMEMIQQFFTELKTIKFGDGCTSRVTYLVKLHDESLSRADEGCSWNGFNHLKSALFEN